MCKPDRDAATEQWAFYQQYKPFAEGLVLAPERLAYMQDLNVPMKNGKVTDATRIERAAPTVAELANKGARVVVLSHFGRPDGKRVPEMSLRPLVEPLAAALGKPVAFAEDCIGPQAEDAVRALNAGKVLLLENLRFHKEEEKNDQGFIDRLSVLGDVYVNDAFSTAHRAHASTEGIANRLPAAAGRLMQAELEALDKALGNPKRPVCAVVGGAKVSTKLDLLGNLVGKVDKLIIGGGMANTFMHAQGIKVGKSLCEKDLAPTALAILEKAKAAKGSAAKKSDNVESYVWRDGEGNICLPGEYLRGAIVAAAKNHMAILVSRC